MLYLLFARQQSLKAGEGSASQLQTSRLIALLKVCVLQDGKTDYKSITLAEDSTAEEFMDFYLDDHARAKWVCLVADNSRHHHPASLYFSYSDSLPPCKRLSEGKRI